MKIVLGLLGCAGLLMGIGAAPVVTPSKVTGDYVEARTAAVFAGACHYNGELVTTGSEAMMAWNIAGGKWNGVELAGVKAMGQVVADKSLDFENAKRRTELVIDTSATPEQADAFSDMVRVRMGGTLGEVVSVRRGSVLFSDTDSKYVVSAEKFGVIKTEAMPDMECCKQPSMVWGEPLVKLSNRMVGYTETAEYKAGTLGDAWLRQGENDAFYGQFAY